MYIYLKTRLFEMWEKRRVKKFFYGNLSFRAKDQALLEAYRGCNPYQISKCFLLQRGEVDPHQYGETPLTTIAKIVREFELSSCDTVIEMGAGRGRAALFLAEYIGCHVLAIEWIPQFIERMVASENLKMIHGNMLEAPFVEASVVFLYGTMLPDCDIVALAKRIPFGIKVITVSYPLNAYFKGYLTRKTIIGRFPWGKTEIYLNERIVQKSLCSVYEPDSSS